MYIFFFLQKCVHFSEPAGLFFSFLVSFELNETPFATIDFLNFTHCENSEIIRKRCSTTCSNYPTLEKNFLGNSKPVEIWWEIPFAGNSSWGVLHVFMFREKNEEKVFPILWIDELTGLIRLNLGRRNTFERKMCYRMTNIDHCITFNFHFYISSFYVFIFESILARR